MFQNATTSNQIQEKHSTRCPQLPIPIPTPSTSKESKKEQEKLHILNILKVP